MPSASRSASRKRDSSLSLIAHRKRTVSPYPAYTAAALAIMPPTCEPIGVMSIFAPDPGHVSARKYSSRATSPRKIE